MNTLKQLLIILLLISSNTILAQELWNKKVDDAQKVLCKIDTLNNCTIIVSNNNEVNLFATSYIINKVDYWQKLINTTKTYTTNDKIKYLRILLNYLNEFNRNTKNRARIKSYNVNLCKDLFEDFDKTIDAQNGKISLLDLIYNKPLLASQIIVNDEYGRMLPDYKEALINIAVKECSLNPEKILSILNLYPDIKGADSLLVVSTYLNQDKIYDFAQCTKCPVNALIKRSSNGLVQTLYKMAQMETGRSLTPFLDAISRNEITIDTINKIQNNRDQYFNLLTTTRIGYSKRLDKGENIIAIKNFNDKIKEVALDYVKNINELHTKPDNIRFVAINPLSTQNLYYIAVLGIDELYTSSFNRGVFSQIITKLKGTSTDKLLQDVNNDYFRKFIKISAGYNKLSPFLKLMSDSSAQVLMNKFITGLVKNDNVYDIEDAVDVADAFVGIGSNQDLKNVSDQILLKVSQFQNNYKIKKDEKGEMVYRILDQIFKAYKDSSINLSAQLGIPPITKVDYSTLATAKDTTIVKLYFYGDEDKDGQYSFQSFMGLFGDKSKWSINTKYKPYFVSIKSLKGKPIQIFANYALWDATKKTDPDDTAKLKMCEYMLKQGLQTTFLMHRGHSYHVPITLDYMERYDTTAKLIVLGSCGGYQNLQKVLEICPDASIVSSKQTGTMRVNDPMLRLLFDNISKNQSILWPEIWPRIKIAVGGGEPGEMFQEYISPEKNLGMIFIKAYKKQMGI